MAILTIFAWVEQIFGDIFAVFAVLGSLLLVLTTFSDTNSSELGQIKQWAVGGFVVSVLGRIAMLIARLSVEKIGIVIPLAPAYVDSLLFLALGLLVLRTWLRSNRFRFE